MTWLARLQRWMRYRRFRHLVKTLCSQSNQRLAGRGIASRREIEGFAYDAVYRPRSR